MCSDYNFLHKLKYLAIVGLIFIASSSYAQNTTSPYSVLGIGDVDTKDFGRYFSSGNASLGRRDAGALNFSNPASLTALPFKTMNFDITFRGRTSTYKYPDFDTTLGKNKDFVVKRIFFAFKLDKKSAVSFGLKPYSSVNYQYYAYGKIADGDGTYVKTIEGDGGIHQLFGSYAREFGKHFSAGITGGFLFGNLYKNTTYTGTDLSYSITKKEYDFYNGANALLGLQYYSSDTKKWQHRVGATAQVATKLKGILTTEYYEGTSTTALTTTQEDNKGFKLPISYGLGYSATYKKKLALSLDGNYYNWPTQSLSSTSNYTTGPSFRISSGIEYSKYAKSFNGMIEKYYLSMGSTVQNSYINLDNNKIWDYSFSFGGGITVTRGTNIYGGMEFGTRGNRNLGQIRENYTQFVIGLTMKDIWIGPRYTRKYD